MDRAPYLNTDRRTPVLVRSGGVEALEETALEVKLPLNLGLNDGTYMPERCVAVLRTHCHRAAMRNYPSAGNDQLKQAIGRWDQVGAENIFLHNGSGPILKQVIPALIKQKITSSPLRIARHLATKNGYPIITPLFTYGKVPGKAADQGLTVHVMPTGPEVGFRVTADQIERHIKKQDGIVYIVNPNNPSGNVMIDRAELEPLIERYPRSTFWVDEAYVQYCEPDHETFSSLVPKYPNLFVSRTFSFAYGLAGAKVGYVLGEPEFLKSEDKKLTDYRIVKLNEELCVAALEDAEHLPWLRQVNAEQRAILTEGLGRHGIEVFPSVTNFVLCRFTDKRTGAELKARLAERKIAIKVMSPFGGTKFDSYFRVTLGLAHENQHFLDAVDEILGS